jgi:hypothetical protein
VVLHELPDALAFHMVELARRPQHARMLGDDLRSRR